MGKKKQTQTQNQSYSNVSTFGHVAPPETDDVRRLRDFEFKADPSIGHAFGSAKSQIGNSFVNPLGGYYSPQMRDAILRSSLADLGQREASARSEAHAGLQRQRYAQRAALAALTAPRMVQTSSSGTGQSTGVVRQDDGLLGSILVGSSGAAA